MYHFLIDPQKAQKWLANHSGIVAVVVVILSSIVSLFFIELHRIITSPPSHLVPPAPSVSCPPNVTSPSPGSILGPAPPPEILIPEIYRSNWTRPNSALPSLDYHVLEPIDPADGKGLGWTVIFIHGLGSINSSHGYQWRETLLSTLQTPIDSRIIGNMTGLRFIIPKAPLIPVTVYSDQPKGGERPGWFDIKDWRDLNYLEDEEGLRQSCIKISTIINRQIIESKMKMNQTIIAGFSQGAVMTLLLSLLLPEPPAATLMLSGYLPLPFRLPLILSSDPEFYHQTTLYWMHGTKDDVLTYNAARSGFQLLSLLSNQAFGRAKFKTFPGLPHYFSPEEAIVVTNWIEGIVDQGSQGEFDSVLDNAINEENQYNDPQF